MNIWVSLSTSSASEGIYIIPHCQKTSPEPSCLHVYRRHSLSGGAHTTRNAIRSLQHTNLRCQAHYLTLRTAVAPCHMLALECGIERRGFHDVGARLRMPRSYLVYHILMCEHGIKGVASREVALRSHVMSCWNMKYPVRCTFPDGRSRWSYIIIVAAANEVTRNEYHRNRANYYQVVASKRTCRHFLATASTNHRRPCRHPGNESPPLLLKGRNPRVIYFDRGLKRPRWRSVAC